MFDLNGKVYAEETDLQPECEPEENVRAQIEASSESESDRNGGSKVRNEQSIENMLGMKFARSHIGLKTELMMLSFIVFVQ